MNRVMRSALVLVCLAAVPAWAQELPENRPPRAGEAGQGARQGGRQAQPQAPGQADLSALSVQQMFDAMAVLEAERFLQLSAEQYPPFVQGLRRLQEARAMFNRRRVGLLNELRRLSQPNAASAGDDAALELKIKDLERLEMEGRQAIRRAYDELDGLLTVRQRARFRVLEDNLEKKKLDFLSRARQGGPGGLGGEIR